MKILRINLSLENPPAWLTHRLINKKNDTAVKSLNMSMPSHAMYQELIKTQSDMTYPFNPEAFINYYTQITQVMPTLAESYHILGFSYYRQGDKEKAFDLFQKAFYINPKYFYTALNLGIMYLEANQRDQAIKIFNFSLQQDPNETLKILATSKIYQDIISANSSYNVVENLKENYQTLELFLNTVKNKPDDPIRKLRNHIRIL